MRQQVATEPGGEVPAAVVVHGNTRIDIAQDTGRNVGMIQVEELETVLSQGIGGPEAWRWGLRHGPDTPYRRSGKIHGYIPSQCPIIHVFTAR
jgi:hypothetical protein